MADNDRARMAMLQRSGKQRIRAADVVDMAMRVHDRVHRRVVPRLQRAHNLAAEGLEAGVEQHQAVGGAQGHDMRERLDHRDVGRDLAQPARDPVDRRGSVVRPFIDEARRQLEQLGHGTPS